jgi:hypothetical protein
MTATIVSPRSAIRLSALHVSIELELSSPDVGSSRNSTVGSAASSMPMFTCTAHRPQCAHPYNRHISHEC